MARTRETRLQAFSRLARIGAGSDDAHRLLEDACSLAAETLGFDRTAVYRLLPSGELVPVVACGADPPLEPVGGLVSPLGERPLFGRALDGVVVVAEPGEDPVAPKTADGPDRAVAIAPLLGRDTCLGFLVGQDGIMDGERVAELRAFADLLAAFLEQALERERLSRLGDLKSHFIALASHELRAPVAVIHGIGVTLDARRRELAMEEVERLHGILNTQTGHLAQLVEQLLDLSRLEANAIAIERAEIPVRERVTEIVQAVARDAADEIELVVEPELRTAVDPAAFDRIVSNLVVNALRYGSPPVRIEAVQRDTHFRLVVEDRGSGVPKEFVPRLFERFARDRSTPAGGSGLGLAIAQSYANAHGGEVVYSAAEPSGARFELVLPRPHNG